MHSVFVLGAIIDLDASFLVQIFLFLALFVTLNILVFQPMLKLYERRRGETEGNEEESRESRERAEELDTAYHAVLAKAEGEGVDLRNAKRDEALKVEAEVLAVARVKASERFEAELVRHSQEVDKARKDAEPVVKQLADEIVSGLTGRMSGSGGQ